VFQLPDLPYPYEALEPTISATSMRLHHDKHHARYVAVVNELVGDKANTGASLESLVSQAAIEGQRKLFNNAARRGAPRRVRRERAA
jgi:Fe-Mn family superoxide dismutase